MFWKVLFPTDFSDYANRTLTCFSDIPGVKEAVLLHVVDATTPSRRGWTHGPEIEKAKIYLEEEKKRLEQLGVKAKTVVNVIMEGNVAGEILKVASDEAASLIVINAHGKSLIKEILLGSVASNVIRRAKIPVLLIRHSLAKELMDEVHEKYCRKIFAKVLFPTDFSVNSLSVLPEIKAVKPDSVVLAHVVTRGETVEELDANVAEARKKLEKIKDDLEKEGIKAEVDVHVGNPVLELLKITEDYDVSLITIPSHGIGRLKEALLGSTTEEIIRKASRPVLILRPEKD